MLNFKEMKKAIEGQHESTRHFTEKFYNNYIATYSDPTMWEVVKASDFYNKNSTAYCVFLELFSEYCKEDYTIVFRDKWNYKLGTLNVRAFNSDEASEHKDDKYYPDCVGWIIITTKGYNELLAQNRI